MSRTLLATLLLASAVLLFVGCGGGGDGGATLLVRVQFPPSESQASRLIPGITKSISIDVTRDGSPLVPRAMILNPGGGPASTTIEDVPTGDATVTASAWSELDPAQGHMVATASTDVTIVEGQNVVEILLQVVIFGRVIDASTREPIQGASVTVSESQATSGKSAGGPRIGADTTDANGDYSVPIGEGLFMVDCEANGYEPGAAGPVGPDPIWGSQRVDFALIPLESPEVVGGISGRVTDDTMHPIAGATVQIGAPETNGVFAATSTAPDGTYGITGFSLVDRDGDPIPDFDVLAFAPGFAPATQVVVIPPNETVPDVDFVLQTGGAGVPIANCEDADQWTMTGLWHARPDLPQVINQFIPGILIPEGYVLLPPDDDSGGALPDAYSPGCAFWYGRDEDGNYVEEHDVAGSEPLDGGLSVAQHQGDLTSPPILLPAGSLTITMLMNSWFEIESVNPHSYDMMTVAVSTNGTDFTDLATLNPDVDPVISEPEIPFGSAGSDKKPVWTLYSLDLSDYQGQTIWLRFRFDTRDALYNGFRGWVIDDIQIMSEPAAGATKLPPNAVPMRLLKPGELDRLPRRGRVS
ncbi:MAG: carboxypeptidase regulatory-like domain-containing protein, partial [Armatimonadota bacterium]